MDRSNLLIGTGVMLGIATFTYWFLNREDGAGGTGEGAGASSSAGAGASSSAGAAERAAQRAADAYARQDDRYTGDVVTAAYPISREQEDDWGQTRRGIAERGY